MDFHHIPVLPDLCVDALNIKTTGRYLDGTLGGGGHSERILKASSPHGVLIGIDRDPEAIRAASTRLSVFGDRFQAVHGCFGSMEQLVQGPFDGILLDLGVSSPQLDQAERGFSFAKDGPLDMRMDPSQGLSAAEWLDEIEEKELASVLFHYGEEPRSRRIARAIIAGRPWRRTLPLAQCIAKASGYRNSRTNPATRSFQAIRIALNQELEQLRQGLDSAIQLLSPQGRLAVISFHSIEDRIVKRHFREVAGIGTPRDAFGHPLIPPLGKLIRPKGFAGKEHDPDNPRARSARLRIFERETYASVSPLSSSPPPA